MTEAIRRIGKVIISFLKKSWEYIALGLSIILGYMLFFDDSAKEKIEKSLRRQKRLEDQDENLQDQEKSVESQRQDLETDLKDLEEEEKEIRKELQEKPEEKKNEEDVKKWLQKNYGENNG